MKLSSWFYTFVLILSLSLGFFVVETAQAGRQTRVTKSRVSKSGPTNSGFRRSRKFDQLMGTTAIVAPLGINPLMALAGLGVVAYWGAWSPPGGLEAIASPWVWSCFLLLGFLMQFGRSFKLTKPVAELLGTGESLLALASISLAMLPVASMVPSSMPAGLSEAGVLTNFGLAILGILSLSAVMVMRIALDFLIWISPIPFVDAFFQFVKLSVTAVLILLAVLFPWVAVIVNLLIILAAFVMLRWAIRLGLFAGLVIGDLSWRKFRGHKEALPVDAVESSDLGPVLVFAERLEAWPKRARLELFLLNGRWMLAKKGKTEDFHPLGEAKNLVFTKTLFAYTLGGLGEEVFLPPRYNVLIEELSRISGSGIANGGEDGRLAVNAVQT